MAVRPVILGVDGAGAVAKGTEPEGKYSPVDFAVASERGTPELPDANGIGRVAFGRGNGISASASSGVRP